MILEKKEIEKHNDKLLSAHKRKINQLTSGVDNASKVIKKLVDFQIAIPSWALGTGGTRFGRFSGGGEPRTLEEKIQDVGLLHALNQSSGAISLHIPWDIPTSTRKIKSLAAEHGLIFDAVNSNTFQDQPNQKHSYKFGSLQHVNKSVRKQAIDHNIEVIKYGKALGSNAITVWLSDGSCFPGQLNFRKAFQRTLEGLQEIYEALPSNWKMYVEYKAFEPNFYSMTVGDWGQSLLYASKLGPKAYTLVDLGHHLPNANIEQIVSLLLMEQKLGGFHFNDSKYGDDDLTVGSINPYQLFLIFNELIEGMDARKMNHATDLGWMIDASHNVKDPLEDLLQSVEAIKIAYAQSLLVDRRELNRAQDTNDVAKAQEILQEAYRTDVRPLVAEARLRAGGSLNPTQLFRESEIRKQLIAERGLKQLPPDYSMRVPVIAIFDIGKTNKKVFLFDEAYAIRFEKSIQIDEIQDEDGFPCEDVVTLSTWITESFLELLALPDYEIKAINFSAHGASFVNVDEKGAPVTPLYNYLKPFPESLQSKFYNAYGGKTFAIATASPVLGHLNSGMQLYWLKEVKSSAFNKIKYALHLPEYVSSLVTKTFVSGITSIGCHTNLWDFQKNNYHSWVSSEKILDKLAPIHSSDQVVKTTFGNRQVNAGIGLHDSSSALIPYLKYFKDPFVLLSTGTWSISLNPFNHTPLTDKELEQDCLCYLTYQGKPVKASRLFAGHEHDEQVKQIAEHFNVPLDYYKRVAYDRNIINKLSSNQTSLTAHATFEEAYHQLILNLVNKQQASTNLIIQNSAVSRIFVDGGFSQNEIYMTLLAKAFSGIKVSAATLHQASALGAAMVIHDHWNSQSLPASMIETIDY